MGEPQAPRQGVPADGAAAAGGCRESLAVLITGTGFLWRSVLRARSRTARRTGTAPSQAEPARSAESVPGRAGSDSRWSSATPHSRQRVATMPIGAQQLDGLAAYRSPPPVRPARGPPADAPRPTA